MIIDTHAHLYFDILYNNINAVLDKARENGITKIITPAVDLKTSEIIMNLSEKYNEIYAAVGFHPSEVKDKDITELKNIEDFLKSSKVVAIGEIGLDYFWDTTFIGLQKSFFSEQINLAVNYNLPVIIHTRDSIKDAIAIIQNPEYRNLKGQFHCFSGDEKDLKIILEMKNYFISFCGNITYKKSELPKLVEKVPVDFLLSETDSPFLTPMPSRGKPNEPAKIVNTIRKISQIVNISYEELLPVLYDNAIKLYPKLMVSE
jgi:TatD DNase family protein